MQMIMRTLFVSAAALLAASNALAADGYVLRHQSPEGTWDFDVASVVIVNGSVRRSQMTLTLTRPLQDQATGKVYDRVVFHYEHDCKADRMRVVDTVSSLKHETVNITRAGEAWQPAGDSVAQKYACSVVEK
jgi:hypothetical protein